MPGERQQEDNEEEEIQIDVIPKDWERCQTAEGIPYYINHVTQRTQWDHPVIKELFKELRSMNIIRSCFGAYRVAAKLRTLQVITNLHKVEGNFIWPVLKDAGFIEQMNASLSVYDVEDLVNNLFGYNKDEQMTKVEIESSTEITLSWVMKCYDSGRTGRVCLRPLLAGLFTLTSSSLTMKYENILKVYSGNTGTISYKILSLFIKEMLMIIECIDEQDLFNTSDVQGTVASFRSIYTSDSDEIRKDMFLGWMKREPQLLVWLPTLHRYVASETVKHEAKCVVCKAYPIVGFRYRCLKCVNTDLCQNCYWTQMGTRTHKGTHPINEYCMATTTTDDIKDFGKVLRNKVTKRYRRRPLKTPYLKPTETSVEETSRQEIKAFSDELHGRINNLVTRLSHDVVINESEPMYDRLRHDVPVQRERVQTLDKENQTITYHHQVTATSTVEYREAGTMTPPIYSQSVVDESEGGPPVLKYHPTSTPMTGFSSLITLDEWTLASSVSEEDKLRELTSILVNAIPETSDNMMILNAAESAGKTDLMDCMSHINVTFEGLLQEFESHTY